MAKTTEETKQKIKVMWKDGLTASEIGKELSLTRRAVMGIVCRMRAAGEDMHNRQPNERVEKKKKTAPLPKPLERNIIDIRIDAGNDTDIIGLTGRSCRYIVSLGGGRDVRYCNSEIERGPYCAHHYRLCYVPINRKAG